MKKKILTLSCMAVLFAFSSNSKAYANDEGLATVTILNQALTISKDTNAANSGNLAFGKITPNIADAGTVTIAADGSRTAAGVTPSGTGDFGAATFAVTGSASTSFNITLPSGSATLTSGLNTMTVSGWTCNDSDLLVQTSVAGTASFKIGGTLAVGANQKAGIYSGPFTVTVAYN
jgi:Mat/Ecp fimbriae major subunit